MTAIEIRNEIPESTRLVTLADAPDSCDVLVREGPFVWIFHFSRVQPDYAHLHANVGVEWLMASPKDLREAVGMPLAGLSPVHTDWRSGSSIDALERRLRQYFDPRKKLDLHFTQVVQFAAQRLNEFILQAGDLESPTFIDNSALLVKQYMIRPIWPDSSRPVIWYGQGECVAGETLIEGPNGSERIDVLAARGQPIRVWSLGPGGPVAAWASAPFEKGHADLFEFRLASGRSIKVTGRHRFLTPLGWRFASELGTGAQLAISSPAPRPIDAYSPSTSCEDALHLSQRDAGLIRHYSSESRPDDLRPLRAKDSGLSVARLSGDARVLDSYGLGRDDPASTQGRNRPYRLDDHPSNGGSFLQLKRLNDCAQFHDESRHSESLYLSTREPSTSPKGCCLPPLILSVFQGQEPSVVEPMLPPLDSLNYDTVLAVSVARHDRFFDLSVPYYANYLANGIWHHNSGKGVMAIGAGVSLCYGVNFAGLRTKALSKGLVYVDYEDNFDEFNIRVNRYSNGLGMAPIPTLHRFDPRGRLFIDIVHTLKAKVDAIGGIDGYIIDSAIPACGGDVIKPEPVGAFFAGLALLGKPSIVIGHEVKDSPTSSAAPFGSQLWRTSSAMTVNFQGSPEPRKDLDGNWVRDLVITCTKANNVPRFTPMAFQLTFTPDDSEGRSPELFDAGTSSFTRIRLLNPVDVSLDLQSRLAPIQQLIGVLAGGREMTLKEIADATGLTYKQVDHTIRRGDVFTSEGGGRGAGNAAKWRLLQGGRS